MSRIPLGRTLQPKEPNARSCNPDKVLRTSLEKMNERLAKVEERVARVEGRLEGGPKREF